MAFYGVLRSEHMMMCSAVPVAADAHVAIKRAEMSGPRHWLILDCGNRFAGVRCSCLAPGLLYPVLPATTSPPHTPWIATKAEVLRFDRDMLRQAMVHDAAVDALIDFPFGP